MENSKTCVVPSHYLLSKSCLQHLESLCSIFPSLKQYFMHNNAEVFALLGCYGTYIDICLPSFSRTAFKGQAVQTESSWTAFTLKMGPIDFAEM
jgi:hypothetical protein